MAEVYEEDQDFYSRREWSQASKHCGNGRAGNGKLRLVELFWAFLLSLGKEAEAVEHKLFFATTSGRCKPDWHAEFDMDCKVKFTHFMEAKFAPSKHWKWSPSKCKFVLRSGARKKKREQKRREREAEEEAEDSASVSDLTDEEVDN